MTTRRRFFGLVAGTPLVAKAASDNVVASLSNIGIDGRGYNILPHPYSSDPPSSTPPSSEIMWEEKLRLSSLHIKTFGIPDYVKEVYREESKKIYYLDPDIANKKSWSMAFKVCCQRERNYQNRLKCIEKHHTRTWKEKALEKVLGFKFPAQTAYY